MSGPPGPGFASRPALVGLAVFLLTAALLLPLLGKREVDTRAEARIPLVALDIVRTGRILPPYLLGEPYLNKPPLHHLLAAAAIEVFGRHDEWVVRLPSVLCGAAAVWLTWLLTTRLAGIQAAVVAAAFLLLSYRFFSLARSTELEILLTAAAALSYLGLARVLWASPDPDRPATSGWWIAAAGAAIAGLTKGPLLAVVFPFTLLVADAIVRRSIRRCLSSGPLIVLLGAAVGTAIYYGPLIVEFGGVSALWKRLTLENVLHAHGFHYYLWQLPLGLLPAGLALPWMLMALRKPDPIPRTCAVAVAIGVILFSLSPSKQSHYLLPLYPLVAAWAGASGVFARWRIGAIACTVALVAAGLWMTDFRWSDERTQADVIRAFAQQARGGPLATMERNPFLAYHLDREDLEIPDGPDEAARLIEDRDGFVVLDLERGETTPPRLATYEMLRDPVGSHTYVLLHKHR